MSLGVIYSEKEQNMLLLAVKLNLDFSNIIKKGRINLSIVFVSFGEKDYSRVVSVVTATRTAGAAAVCKVLVFKIATSFCY